MKSFGGRTVLQPTRLTVLPGEIHMLLGQNGSGKSTLIKVLSGLHSPDAGRCRVAGTELAFGTPESSHALGLRFVHQDLGLIEDASVADNLHFGNRFPTRWGTVSARRMTAVAREALTRVGLDIDPRTPVADLTAAQRTGVAVARALSGSERATVLVLDEPTASLPASEVAHLHSMLRTAAAEGLGVLYVTHHLDEVYALAQRVSILRDGVLVLSASVEDTSRDDLVHALVGGELEEVRREADHLAASPPGGAPPVLQVEDVTGEVLAGVSLTVRAGEIVGVYGLTGSGRESVLGAIFGARPRDGGSVRVEGRPLAQFRPAASVRAGLAYVPPDRKAAGGFMDLTAAENLSISDVRRFWARGFLSSGAEQRDSADWFERLDVRPRDGVKLPLRTFSGGNQQKVVMGRWLRIDPRVLLLDEPTQGVDVGAKAELHRQVLSASARGTAVLVSSTDVEELVTLCDRVLIMRAGRVAEELSGERVNENAINHSFHQHTSTQKAE
ncbi:sugar ABC transporter ATP-binding protein [Blastococcus litoris]|uniref:sugar ABC transporter ATP-binding protein n=1 Tax=Blastococcus litoris TaxID=2171622 RepID=UPI0019D02FF1|nr:sugar ABC transporter ATP-binding protein [Blastococcus litoris]